MSQLEESQMEDGKWLYHFEGPLLTDSFFIVTVRALQMNEEQLVSRLIKKLEKQQQKNGGWKLHSDEREGNLSVTIQAYTALLLSGKYSREEPIMRKAEAFIKENGGLSKAHFMTKMLLAVNGLYSYPTLFYFPMTYFLLPAQFPFSMYKSSSYARVHLTPMIICLNKKFSVVHDDLDTSFFDEAEGNWFRDERNEWTKYILEETKKWALTPLHLHKEGYKAAERVMLNRIEKNGTLFSYASASFYMIYALMALGYERNASVIVNAMKGIKSYVTETERGLHVQNSPSEVWDTALLSYALQEAGMSDEHPVIVKANSYLLKKQQHLHGDWAVNAPEAKAGGWGFSDSNHFIPDHDDTSAALRALKRQSVKERHVKKSVDRGKNYLLAMQNADGGWGAFEKNAYHPLFAYLPIENASDALVDDSSADLTGRVLEYLGNYEHYDMNSPIIKKAVDWLLDHQEDNGSWYGKWGVCYIYGTWAAVTGLRAVGIKKDHPSILKAIRWLEKIQHNNGGWGESCHSATIKRFVKLPFSTPSQTAWALDALLTVRGPNALSVNQAVQYLLNVEESDVQSLNYPTGLGLAGGYYIHYESYNILYPLLALGHFTALHSKK